MLPRSSEVDAEELATTSDDPPRSHVDNVFEQEPPDTLRQRPADSRRLGLRAAVSFGVFVTRHGQRLRARAAEISTTGVLLDFRHTGPCPRDGLVTLELAVPGLRQPIRCAARFARQVGAREAFEFMIIGRDERLSLAEYIDRVARRAAAS